jgi:hypothetical protein
MDESGTLTYSGSPRLDRAVRFRGNYVVEHRIAVGKSIRRTLQHIAEADATIGEHLRRTVRTGARCSYWPG